MSGARALSKQEHIQVKSNFNKLRDKCLYVLGISTGYRISELLSISVYDVLNKDYVKVSKKNIKGKTESRESVLNNEAKECIREYLAERDTKADGPLFISRQGGNKPISRMQAHRILRDSFSKSGLTGSLSSHSCRKSYALNIYEKSNHDLLLVQKALAHSSIMTTVKYLPVNQDKLNRIILEE